MEDQMRSTETLRQVSGQGSPKEGSATTHTTSDQEKDRTVEENTRNVTPRSKKGEEDADVKKHIFFKDHNGDRYIWPFEQCRSFDALKPLLEEVYTTLDLLDEIQQGRYNMQTEDGAIILPSVWSDIVKPFETYQADFPERYRPRAKELREHPLNYHRSSMVDSVPDQSDFSYDGRDRETVREVTFDDDGRDYEKAQEVSFEDPGYDEEKVQVTLDDNGYDHEKVQEVTFDDDSSSESSTSQDDDNEAELSKQPDPPEPIRDVVPPIDTEGNKLSFQVDTARCSAFLTPNKQPGSSGGSSEGLGVQLESTETHIETLRITKAMSAEIEGRNMIQLHTMSGPENALLRGSLRMTWYHIPAERLDYSRFKNVCLAVPYLSERVQTLTREVLQKVEKDKVRASLDGMFIDPGTVLRADERGQTGSQSVIFSCLPYFNLQSPAKKLPTRLGDRLFPSRTLMQSYYPYEPVRERDAEQAYRKFGNDHSDKLVHVSSLWMMNIGPNTVVTCGHRPLSDEMVKSIAVVREDIPHLGTKNTMNNSSTNIRLTDWDDRVLIFPLDVCRSYFQMEQKVRELKYTARGNVQSRSLQIKRKTSDGKKIVTPGNWSGMIGSNGRIFIDLALLNDRDTKELRDQQLKADVSELLTRSPSCLVPPFFHWPCTPTEDAGKEKEKTQAFVTPDVKRSMHYLEDVERRIMSETLDNDETINAVDKDFTSTAFYQSLPEDTHERLSTDFTSLAHIPLQARVGTSPTQHEFIVDTQCTDIVEHAAEFFSIVHATLGLFVNDVNEGKMLRKVWGAMAKVHKQAFAIERRGPREPDLGETDTFWCIRNPRGEYGFPAPEANAGFKKSIKHCRLCMGVEQFHSLEAALAHLRTHVKPAPQSDQAGIPIISETLPPPPQPLRSLPSGLDFRDWVVNSIERRREADNANALAIFIQAYETAKDLFSEAKELIEGVQNEDGKMSELYTLPHQLIDAFRQIVVFYLAIERALHHNEDSPRVPLKERLTILQRFSGSARRSLILVRHELCDMVQSKPPLDVLKTLSLGPEYVCAWLMRRLLVKPLERYMTIGDMYREYLSTIQFQVNHRPGKRLLRSINLLQEELHILSEVNTWQTKLIQNYMRVLDDTTYEQDSPSRRAMFPYERMLLRSCLENLNLANEEYADLIRRCGPLSDSTKQSLEINEEDHGKAIMVFTLVTVIFLPLSFVTSYLGMNTVDIRDMERGQSLFYIIAIPLTLVTMGACLIIGYNGDELRDTMSSIYRTVAGKQDRRTSARGISVAQRKRARKLQSDMDGSTPDYNSLADEAEFASPLPEYYTNEYSRKTIMAADYNPSYRIDVEPATFKLDMPTSRAKFQTQSFAENISLPPAPAYQRTGIYTDPASRRFRGYRDADYGSGQERGRYYQSEGLYDRPDQQVEYTAPAMLPVPEKERDYRDDKDLFYDDGLGLQEYTWHKKRSHKYSGREREPGVRWRTDVSR